MRHHDTKWRSRYLSHLVAILGTMAITGCYGGVEEEATQPPGIEPPSSSTISFVVDVQPIFTQNCATSGCHDAVTSTLGLNLEADIAHDNIVSVASQEVPTQHYVTPGDPDNSYLFLKIAGAPGIVGNRMPLDNATFFEDNPEQLALIRLWILEGAMNN